MVLFKKRKYKVTEEVYPTVGVAAHQRGMVFLLNVHENIYCHICCRNKTSVKIQAHKTMTEDKAGRSTYVYTKVTSSYR